jgi:uncharacterized membrane protein
MMAGGAWVGMVSWGLGFVAFIAVAVWFAVRSARPGSVATTAAPDAPIKNAREFLDHRFALGDIDVDADHTRPAVLHDHAPDRTT